MATAGDIVTRALRLIGAYAAGETPSAEDMRDGLADLNEMAHSWRTNGINLGWSDVEQSDDVGIDDAHLRAFRLNLAVQLSPSYGINPAAVMIGARSLSDEATIELRRVKAEYRSRKVVPADIGVLRLSRQATSC